MVKKILLGCVAIGSVWLWWEWDHLVIMKASADPWQPPPTAASTEPPIPREPCRDYTPTRRALFGDLHIHTRFSFDARSRDMLGSVDDAYRFARGETIGLGPFDAGGKGQRTAQLERPLDFAAVTDHAEWIGEVVACDTPDSASYNSQACRIFRGEIRDDSWVSSLITGGQGNRMISIIGSMGRSKEVCGENAEHCRTGLKSAWEENQRATEDWYDRSADCSFTSFHGYEHSYSPGRSKVHRNIIFRNERVPELPISSLEESDPYRLWESLDALCSDTGGDCEALSIPHNSNVSNGRTFRITWRDAPLAEQQRLASLRERWEPLVEMMQVKGESECAEGLWQVLGEDDLCNFEKIREMNNLALEDCEDDYGTGAITGVGCRSRLDFARYALVEGMAEKRRIGINPYRFGFIGSTDSHNATPGDTDEENYQGCCANTDNTIETRMGGHKDFAGSPVVARNPGGLMGAWAEENTRDALFDAMQRREVFATSGPRITPRLFAGWNIPDYACDEDTAALGYTGGVPMGGELKATKDQVSPAFLAASSADPAGNPLQRLQLVKVWRGQGDAFHQSVYDLAGGENDASVDLDSCQPTGAGASQFCTVWHDPAFDAGQDAAYYLRVVENPSCRWSWRQCLQLPEAERPSACNDPKIPRIIQERAWTSPIWVSSS